MAKVTIMEPTTFPAGLIALALCWTLTRPAERQLITRAARRSWPVFRPAIGWVCLVLGVLGVILPVLQGVLFLVIGAALVGPRHPLIRRVRAGYKLLLRRLAHRTAGCPPATGLTAPPPII